DLLDALQHVRMFVLTRVAQFLGEVALPGEDDADAGYLLQHLWQVTNPLGALDHQAAEQLALGVQGPHIGPGVVLLLAHAPIGDGAIGGIAAAAEGLAQQASLAPWIAHGGHGVIGILDRIDVGPDDPIHADVEYLFGDPVGLSLVRWNTYDGGDR